MIFISQITAGSGSVSYLGMSVGTITIIFSSIFSFCVLITILAIIIKIRLVRQRQIQDA